jgi:hypothetical protein
MRTAQRRLRAFYLSARPMTVVVHERVVPGLPGRLVGGARMLDRLQGRGELVIPRLLEVGTAMRAEWVVEELLTGAHPRVAERAVVAGDIARLLLATYEQVGVWHRPLRSFPTRGLAGAAAQLAATPDSLGGQSRLVRPAEPWGPFVLYHQTMTAGPTVRPATDADAEAIATLFTDEGYPAGPSDIRERLSRFDSTFSTVRVAELGGDVVSFVAGAIIYASARRPHRPHPGHDRRCWRA